MDIHEIRETMRFKSIFEIPLRVTYYARVSTDSDVQLNSLSNQIKYYEDLIRKNPAWIFVPGYIDEGISGISTKHRENFNRMIDDASEGNFDLIVTKEISRFARNTLDSIQFTRTLLSYGVGVYFQNDNINTFDEDSELRLSIMSSMAQDELRKLSSRIKFGHQQAIKSNVVLGNNNIFGYRKENKRLVIDDYEAEMVRTIFELYSTDKYSMKQIEKILWDKGYRNHNGNKINHNTISNMIANPKYKGYYVGNKVKVIDMFTKKQKFLPQEEWVMFKDETGEIVPAIVSEELWEEANKVLKRRSEDVKNRQGICNHANLLTGKMYCADCGTLYYRKDSGRKGKSNSNWICSNKINSGAAACKSFAIYEDEIKEILFQVFRDSKASSDAMIEEYQKMYRSLSEDGNLEKHIEAEKKKIEMAVKKKNALLELVAQGNITGADFKKLSAECNREQVEAENEIIELESKFVSTEEFRKQMNEIRTVLQRAETIANKEAITESFVHTFVDKIIVTPIDETTAQLSIKIFTGETTEQYIEKLKKRSGKTVDTHEKKPLKEAENKAENEVENSAGQTTAENTCQGENPCVSTDSVSESRAGQTLLTIWPPTEPASFEERSPL